MSDGIDETDSPSPYAGRWIACLQGRIIAHGGTPEQARLAAQNSRHKETPEISYMRPSASLFFPSLIDQVRAALPDMEIYLVGGAVRDALLGRVSHDFDFAVPAHAISLARRVASALRADFYVLDEDFDVARVILSSAKGVRDFLDFSSYRDMEPGPIAYPELTRVGRENGAIDKGLSSRKDLYADLQGRDFTINSIALDLRDQTVHDPLGGASDVRKKTIRACSPKSFANDPVRILRAVRQAAAFGFSIEAGTRRAMKELASLLSSVSAERQRDELFKILDGPRPAACLRAMEMLGCLPFLLPELPQMKGVAQSAPHMHDVWEHTLSVVENLDEILDVLAPGFDAAKSNDIWTGLLSARLGRFRTQFESHFSAVLNVDRSPRSLLIFAALYHDIAKPATRLVDEAGRARFQGHDAQGAVVAVARGRAFNLSKNELQRIQLIIANHMRFHFHVARRQGQNGAPSRRAIYRFFRDTGEAGVDLMLLGLADLRGTRAVALTEAEWTAALDVARIFLENYWEKPEESVSPAILVGGTDVMEAFGLQSGRLIGQVLQAVREAQAAGMIATRAEALDFAGGWLRDHQQ